MLAPAAPDRKVRSNITTGDRFEMGIHSDAVAMVMESLAGLYSDQLTAILREYATNAIDAHRMAGVTRPIEVTLPSRMTPTLRIQDFGIGLDLPDLREIYSQYGASTKRQSNDFNGTLGFGCKSALAYADMFNVTSVKDGQKIHAVVAKGENLPTFNVIGSGATSEPSGTTIEIPVSDYRDQTSLAEKATKLYSYFDDGAVLVGGAAVPAFKYHLKLTDDIYVIKREASDRYSYSYRPAEPVQSLVLMSNVPYPAQIDHGLKDGYGIVAKVPNGSVEFTPAREGLKMHKQSTKRTLAGIESTIRNTMVNVVQRDVDAATTPAEAIQAMLQWREVLDDSAMPAPGSLKYKGREVPVKLSAGPAPKNSDGSDNEDFAPHFCVVHHRCNRKTDFQMYRTLRIDFMIDDIVWIENFDQGFTATVRRKIEQWATKRPGSRPPKSYVFTDGPAPDFWVDRANVIDYLTDIKPIKLSQLNVGGYRHNRPRGSYTAYVAGAQQAIEAGNIDTNEPLFWVRGGRAVASRYVSVLTKTWPKCTIIYMPSNRVNKFKRDFPMARTCDAGAVDAWTRFESSLSADTLKAMAYSDAGWQNYVNSLDAKRVSDPDLKEAIRICKIDVVDAERAERTFFGLVSQSLKRPTIAHPLAKYPLAAGRYGPSSSDHLYVYLEAAWRAYKSGVLK